MPNNSPTGNDRVASVLALDHQWDAWTGNTIEALAAVVGIIEQRGFKIWGLFCSRKRFHLLLDAGAFPSDNPPLSDACFQRHPVLCSETVLDNSVYVIGDAWPLSQKSVGVLVWERNTKGRLP